MSTSLFDFLRWAAENTNSTSYGAILQGAMSYFIHAEHQQITGKDPMDKDWAWPTTKEAESYKKKFWRLHLGEPQEVSS